MTENQNKRFLRDGVLDEMIKRLREMDKQNWTLNKMAIPTTASIIQLFELNRMILKDVEKHLDIVVDLEKEWYEKLLPIAHNLQDGLRNTFQGLEDEWEHFVDLSNDDMIDDSSSDDPC